MDNNLSRIEREQIDQLSKSALEQLIFKDDIINDLRIQLDNEQNENNSLKKKCNELESKIEELDDSVKFQLSTYSNQKINLSNSNPNFELMKLNEEKLEIEKKFINLENDYNILIEKSKNLSDIDNLYKSQIESQKRKIEKLEMLERNIKDKESYIDEMNNEFEKLKFDYDEIISNKNSEIKELSSRLQYITENYNKLNLQMIQSNQNNNSTSLEYKKQIHLLEDRIKELEMNFYNVEMSYKDEIRKLQNFKEEKGKDSLNSLKVEDLNIFTPEER